MNTPSSPPPPSPPRRSLAPFFEAVRVMYAQEIAERRRLNMNRVRLPAELWVKIASIHRISAFEDFQDSMRSNGPLVLPYDYIYLSHVCFFLRQTLIDYRKLWDIVVSTPATPFELVQEFCRRSRLHKMNIVILVNPRTPHSPRLIQQLSHLLPHALSINLYLETRVKEEPMHADESLPIVVSGVQSILVGRPPSNWPEGLRDIPYNLERFVLVNAQKLAIFNCRLDASSFPANAGNQLTQLIIKHHDMTPGPPRMHISQVLDVVKRLSNLQLLHLEHTLFATDIGPEEYQHISLPCLQKLIVNNGGPVSAFLLCHLIIPSTAHISLFVTSTHRVEELEDVLKTLNSHFLLSPRSFGSFSIHRENGAIVLRCHDGAALQSQPSFILIVPDGLRVPQTLFSLLNCFPILTVKHIFFASSLLSDVSPAGLKNVIHLTRRLETVVLAGIIPPTGTCQHASDVILRKQGDNDFRCHAPSLNDDLSRFPRARKIIDRVRKVWASQIPIPIRYAVYVYHCSSLRTNITTCRRVR